MSTMDNGQNSIRGKSNRSNTVDRLVFFCSALLCFVAEGALTSPTPATADTANLLQNGHFDDATDPLNHWFYVFDNNKHYLKNHTYVSVVEDKASMRTHVLRLDASDLNVCQNQGVQIYSGPIRFDPKKKYKISLSARSAGTKGGKGPTCRIYPIAYRWHPKAVKSNEPAFGDLREDVRFHAIYFNNAETGEFSNVPSQWKRVEYVIPDPSRSQLQQSHLENCVWLMLKIMAIDAGTTGYLYVDDVKIEENGLADEVKITAGAATKGFDGKSWSSSKVGDEKKLAPSSAQKAKPSNPLDKKK